MAYTIRALTPDLANVFCDYLTHLDFANTPHWASCFCRYYHLTCSMEEWHSRSLETNRAEALREIAAGNMRGYLAFDGETCVGWCNANDIVNLPRLFSDVEELCREKRVGCTICYVIHPDHRGRGLARMLLARAIADFQASGFDAVLAFPIEAPGVEQRRYRGTLHMYQEAGFTEIRAEDNLHVMWLDLTKN
jgi:GNAT superfamily N-acetyltransferase